MNEDTIKGNVDKVTGKIKEAVGHLTNNKDLEAKGKLDQVRGSAEEAVGRAKDASKDIGKTIDKQAR
ncbi:CsbD family protein [Granulicella paludicola]|uniref:CsbD family protein n=1 Tax=Granulicella paludicola TaxID=474951 RepID=UPI0021E0080C|nr:CsbD family protein [Granulicella paludicola]